MKYYFILCPLTLPAYLSTEGRQGSAYGALAGQSERKESFELILFLPGGLKMLEVDVVS